MFKTKIISFCLVAGFLTIEASTALAGGCAPGQPCWEDDTPKVRRPVAPAKKEMIEPVVEEVEAVEIEEISMDEEIESNSQLALSAGVNVLFFDCEDASVAPGIFADYRPSQDLPVNIRLGVEGSEIDGTEQFEFRQNTEFTDSADFSFVRIPLSVEYVHDVNEDTKVFVGGGPDLITVSDDGSDTIVGLHLEARVQKDITERIGVSVGAGYLFADADVGSNDEELDLDSAYTGVHLVANLF